MPEQWKPIADEVLDFMEEDPHQPNHPEYTKRLVREVGQLQGVILSFLEAWDACPANMEQMDKAIAEARRAIGQEAPAT